jgi:alkaline phosphatase D
MKKNKLKIFGLILILTIFSPQETNSQTNQWPDPIASDVLPYETTGLTHGPLLGRVTSNSLRVWVRTLSVKKFEVICDTQIPFSKDAKIFPGETAQEKDLTGTIDLINLKPNTRYYYGVRIDGNLADLRSDVHQAWPSFKTLPDKTTCLDKKYNPNGLFNVQFGIGHCASQDPHVSGGQYVSTPAYDTIRKQHAEDAMFTLVNGDVIYEERRNGELAGIRENYRLYFSRGRSFASLFRNVPALFTFDDHDVGWDIHGCGQIGLGEGPHLIRDLGLSAYQEYLSWANYQGPQTSKIHLGTAKVTAKSNILVDEEADFTSLNPAQVSTIHLGNYTRGSSLRRKNAPKNAGVYGLTKVLDKHRLEITPAAKTDETLRYSIGTHHYYDWKIANCHFFALDTRGERSNRNSKDRFSDKLFILGEAQKKWLLDGISKTDAQFIFLISPDPWTIYHTGAHVGGSDEDDKGDGFPSFVHEREELLRFLDQLEKPVLIFTGDVHASASVKITDNVWEMMCGPLGSTGHPLGTLGNPPSGGKWKSKGREVEIRWVSGFPNNLPYQRIRNTYYGIVQVNNVLKVGTPTGVGYQWVAYDEPQVIVRWHDGYTGKLVYAESITSLDAKKTSK